MNYSPRANAMLQDLANMDLTFWLVLLIGTLCALLLLYLKFVYKTLPSRVAHPTSMQLGILMRKLFFELPVSSFV